MIADGLTKKLPRQRHEDFIQPSRHDPSIIRGFSNDHIYLYAGARVWQVL